MHPILRISLILVAVFLSLLLLSRAFGVLSLDQIQSWLNWAHAQDPLILASIIIGLLLLDLVFSIPTLTVALLAGYFLGFSQGAGVLLLGLGSAALLAYYTSRWRGGFALQLLLEQSEQERLRQDFQSHGSLMILLARSAPMLPEISYCLAGVSGMPLHKLMFWFLCGHIPYCLLLAYAGSQSQLSEPYPALAAVFLLYGLLWLSAWHLRRKSIKVQQPLSD
jgi:uncharacterized membrane protein YdjX (TVP38/TMEM64 family)